MASFKKLDFDCLLGLKCIVPSTDQRGKELLRTVSSDLAKFRELLLGWISNGRSMTQFQSVAPILVGMFSCCAGMVGPVKTIAKKVSDKTLTDGETIWGLLTEGSGKELENKLRSDMDFQNMLGQFFVGLDPRALNELKKDLLYLIGKITPKALGDRDDLIHLVNAIEHMTGVKLTNRRVAEASRINRLKSKFYEIIAEHFAKNLKGKGSSGPPKTFQKSPSPSLWSGFPYCDGSTATNALRVPDPDSLPDSRALDKVKRIYDSLYDELTFDKEEGNKHKHEGDRTVTLAEVYNKDVQVTKDIHRGNCRQFTHRLVFELLREGIWARPIIIDMGDSSHIATLYRLRPRGPYFVADLGMDLQTVHSGNLCILTVDKFIEIFRSLHAVQGFYVLPDDPSAANYPIDLSGSKMIPLERFIGK